MDYFHLYSEERDIANRIKAMTVVVDGLKEALGHFDISTRRLVWQRLTSRRGEELVEKFLRNPRTPLSESEFRKLAEGDWH